MATDGRTTVTQCRFNYFYVFQNKSSSSHKKYNNNNIQCHSFGAVVSLYYGTEFSSKPNFLYWEQTYSKYDVIFVPVIVQMFDEKCNNVPCYTCGIGFKNTHPGVDGDRERERVVSYLIGLQH